MMLGRKMSKQNNHPVNPKKQSGAVEDQGTIVSETMEPESGVKPEDAEVHKETAAETEEQPVTPEQKIAELEAQLAEANDQYLRKAADFENFRKRMNREKQESIEYANQSLLLDLVETMDDFERALISAESSIANGETSEQAFKAFFEGVAMIEKRLYSQMESKWGLKRYVSANEPFDPNFHEAVMMEKSPDITEPVVQEEFNKGYTLKERVVRHAKVKVLMPGAVVSE